MSEFYDLLDQYVGAADDVTDIRAVVRRCWFYDFLDNPIRLWQGQGKLFTSDDNEWLGTVDGNGRDVHKTPSISDGRDGSSATYNFTLNIVDVPGQPAFETYDMLKTDQFRIKGRSITCFLALFEPGEALRPKTPIVYFKILEMLSARFSENISLDSNGTMLKKYSATVVAKDGNSGRSNVPGGTYSDAVQKERARQLGVSLDRGSEFLARLANRTYQIP